MLAAWWYLLRGKSQKSNVEGTTLFSSCLPRDPPSQFSTNPGNSRKSQARVANGKKHEISSSEGQAGFQDLDYEFGAVAAVIRLAPAPGSRLSALDVPLGLPPAGRGLMTQWGTRSNPRDQRTGPSSGPHH